MTIELWVVGRRVKVMSSPSLQEVLELGTGELWASICAKSEGHTNFPVVCSGVAFAGKDNRPALESISDYNERFPVTEKKSADTDSKDLFGLFSLTRGSCY